MSQYGARGVSTCVMNVPYSRRQRAVSFAGATRTITIPLELADFERLQQLATKHNVGNATLGRQIIRKYLKREANEDPLAVK